MVLFTPLRGMPRSVIAFIQTSLYSKPWSKKILDIVAIASRFAILIKKHDEGISFYTLNPSPNPLMLPFARKSVNSSDGFRPNLAPKAPRLFLLRQDVRPNRQFHLPALEHLWVQI